MRPHNKGNGTFKGRFEGGLGHLDEKNPKARQRGRKYYLSIAHKQAN
jgi:hypothetical protein